MKSNPQEVEIDLTNCASEPIHVPGRIQPHGVLLALSEPELTITRASTSSETVLGRSAETLIGQPIESLVGPLQLAEFRERPTADWLLKRNPLKLRIERGGQDLAFDGIVHRSNDLLVLELERSRDEAGVSFVNLYQQIHGAIATIESTQSLSDLSRATAIEIRQLTGFDRVMIYQFDAEWNGKVIAEDKAPGMAPFLGLQFPASDIPKQARDLYTRNWLRLIPDAIYTPSDIVPGHRAEAPEALDLSFSVLRSVSPIHLEYLGNMGVRASMSVSLIRDGQLWGLIACHHRTARYLPFESRLGCEFVGKFMSLQLAAKEKSEATDFKRRVKELQPVFFTRMRELQAGDFLEGLVNRKPDILELTNATGAAIVYHDDCKLLGQTPGRPAILELTRWLSKEARPDLFVTDSLPKEYPAAGEFRETGSGVIALRIPEPGDQYVLWFRPEVIQTVNWAGNPSKSVEPSPKAQAGLSPRKSFELWKETVRLRSLPWTAAEIDAAGELRRSLIDVDLQRQLIREREARAEAERSNHELDQFAYVVSHDLKEPVRGIRHYADFIMEDELQKVGEESRTHLKEIKLLAAHTEALLTSLHQHSKIGRVQLSYADTDLNEVVEHVLASLKAQIERSHAVVQVPRALPSVFCDFVRIGEVFSNLVSNALKYASAPGPRVEIGYTEGPSPVFFVKDDGIGIPSQSHGTVFEMFKRLHAADEFGGGSGSGLTISRQIVERHGGRIWIESEIGKGATFFFTLQAAAGARG